MVASRSSRDVEEAVQPGLSGREPKQEACLLRAQLGCWAGSWEGRSQHPPKWPSPRSLWRPSKAMSDARVVTSYAMERSRPTEKMAPAPPCAVDICGRGQRHRGTSRKPCLTAWPYCLYRTAWPYCLVLSRRGHLRPRPTARWSNTPRKPRLNSELAGGLTRRHHHNAPASAPLHPHPNARSVSLATALSKATPPPSPTTHGEPAASSSAHAAAGEQGGSPRRAAQAGLGR
jgi:hypothetical protein